MEVRLAALHAFCLSDPLEKTSAVQALWPQAATLPLDTLAELPAPAQPGRPDRPLLVQPKEVPLRSPFTPLGHAALILSLIHI